MAPWMTWLGRLLAMLAGFMHDNPFPRHAGRFRAPRPALVILDGSQIQMMTPADYQVQAPAPEKPHERVVDTIRTTEGFGSTKRDATYQWVENSAQPGVLLLFKEGKQVGGWNVQAKLYLAYDAATNKWDGHYERRCDGTRCQVVFVPNWKESPPVPLPEPCGRSDAGERPQAAYGQVLTGVDHDKLKDAGEQYLRGGTRIGRGQSFAALAEAARSLPADADALRLTCTGSTCRPEKLLGDLLAANGPLAPWKSKVTVQCYASADDPMLKGLGYAASGVQVQAPDGLPLWYAAQYDGPEELAHGLKLAQGRWEFAQARRKDGTWDPAKWQDLAKTADAAPAPKPDPKPEPDPKPKPKKPRASDDDPPPAPEPTPAPSPSNTPWYIALGSALVVIAGLLKKYGPMLLRLRLRLAEIESSVKPPEPPKPTA